MKKMVKKISWKKKFFSRGQEDLIFVFRKPVTRVSVTVGMPRPKVFARALSLPPNVEAKERSKKTGEIHMTILGPTTDEVRATAKRFFDKMVADKKLVVVGTPYKKKDPFVVTGRKKPRAKPKKRSKSVLK